MKHVAWMVMAAATAHADPDLKPVADGTATGHVQIDQRYGDAGTFQLSDGVRSAVFRGDGRELLLATTGAARRPGLELWTADGQLVHDAETGEPAIAIGYGAHAIFALTAKGTLTARDSITLQPTHTVKLAVTADAVAAFTARGLVIVEPGRRVRIVDPSTGAAVVPEQAAPAFDRAAVSPDGAVLAISAADRISAVKLATGKQLVSVPAGGPVGALATDGKTLAWSTQLRVAIASVATGKLTELSPLDKAERPMHTPPVDGQPRAYLVYENVSALTYSPDGHWLLAQTSFDRLQLFDTGTAKLATEARVNAHAGSAAAFSPDGTRVVTLAERPAVQILTVPTLVEHGGKPASNCTLTAASPDGKRLACAGQHRLELFDVASGASLHVLPIDQTIEGLGWSRDGTRVVAAGYLVGGVVSSWEVASGAQKQRVTLDVIAGGVVVDSSTGELFIADGISGTTRVLDVDSLAIVRSLSLGKGVHGLAVRGTLLAAAREASASIHDRVTGATIRELPFAWNASSYVSAVAFSPLGDRLAATHGMGAVIVWQVATGKRVLGVAPARPAIVHAVVFSADGKLVVTSGRQLRAYDLAGTLVAFEELRSEAAGLEVVASGLFVALATHGTLRVEIR